MHAQAFLCGMRSAQYGAEGALSVKRTGDEQDKFLKIQHSFFSMKGVQIAPRV